MDLVGYESEEDSEEDRKKNDNSNTVKESSSTSNEEKPLDNSKNTNNNDKTNKENQNDNNINLISLREEVRYLSMPNINVNDEIENLVNEENKSTLSQITINKLNQLNELRKDKNLNFNEHLQSLESFLNPQMFNILTNHLNINEYGTNCSNDIFDPENLPEEAFVKAIMTKQKQLMSAKSGNSSKK